jgi:hypothetical protein
VAGLSGVGSLQFLIQAQIAAVDDCSKGEVAAREVIPWSLLVVVDWFDLFLWEILVHVLGFLGAQFPDSPFWVVVLRAQVVRLDRRRGPHGRATREAEAGQQRDREQRVEVGLRASARAARRWHV